MGIENKPVEGSNKEDKVLTHDRMKYLVVEVEGEKRLVTGFAIDNAVLHKSILLRYQRKYGIRKVDVYGGGRISIYREEKVIRAYDYSSDFGHAHTETVRSLIKAAALEEGFADWEVRIAGTLDYLKNVRCIERVIRLE